MLPLRNFFPFQNRPLFRRDWCAGKQTGSHRSFLPSRKGQTFQSVSSTSNAKDAPAMASTVSLCSQLHSARYGRSNVQHARKSLMQYGNRQGIDQLARLCSLIWPSQFVHIFYSTQCFCKWHEGYDQADLSLHCINVIRAIFMCCTLYSSRHNYLPPSVVAV